MTHFSRNELRAPWAADPLKTRGRLYPEGESAFRTPFQRDRDRIIHSSAFRRLKHKTQVFVEHEGDYYRTRLTHTLEVAQVARTMARALGLDSDLTEAVALAHDLGHPPFGHTGEDVLAELMAPFGGFDHNAQAIRIVTALERHYAEFDGLNLTWETLEGMAKHNGPLIGPFAEKGEAHTAVPPVLAEYDARHDLELHTHASAEAQIAAIADDIAYNNHDLHDGLRAGLFTDEEIAALVLVGPAYEEVDALYPGLETTRRRHEALRRVFGAMVEDVISETERRIAALSPDSVDDIRAASHQVAAFSEEMTACIGELRAFLFQRMYRAPTVMEKRAEVSQVLRDLFPLYMNDPALLPAEWQEEVAKAHSDEVLARLVADYIAGMTDRFALAEHARLVGPSARSAAMAESEA